MNLQRFLEPPARVASHETWQSLLAQPNGESALHYFLLNIILLSAVWLMGSALLDVLATRTRAGVLQPNNGAPPASLGLFFSLVSGLACLIAVLFMLAAIQCLRAEVVYPVLASLCLASACTRIWCIRQGTHFRVQWPSTVWGWMLACILAVLLVLTLFALPKVPGLGDATGFHAPYAAFFLKQHGLAVDEHLIYPYHTFNINLFYSFGLMLDYSLTYMQTLHGLFMVLSMLGLYATARALRLHPVLCVLPSFLLSEVFSVKYGIAIANVDLGGMLFTFGAVLGVWCYCRYASRVFLIASAMSLGMAMGSKYILCAMALPIGLVIICQGWPRFWRDLLLYIGVAACWGLWWYIRSAWLTGNPVHPFASEIFGYYLWTPEDMQSQMVGLSNPWIPRTIEGLLAAPYHAFYSDVLREQDVCLVLGLLWVSTALSGLANRQASVFLLCAWVWVSSWIWGSQDPRHFLPALPLILLCTAIVLQGVLVRAASLLPVLASKGGRVLVQVLCLPVLLASLGLAGMAVNQRVVEIFYGGPLTAGPEQDAFVARDPTCGIMLAANAAFSESETVYEFASRDGRWYFKGNMVGSPFGPHGYIEVINQGMDEHGLNAPKLQTVLQRRYQAAGVILRNPPFLPYEQTEFDNFYQLVYRDQTHSLYRFREQISP